MKLWKSNDLAKQFSCEAFRYKKNKHAKNKQERIIY